jgi:hypothetical protein
MNSLPPCHIVWTNLRGSTFQTRSYSAEFASAEKHRSQPHLVEVSKLQYRQQIVAGLVAALKRTSRLRYIWEWWSTNRRPSFANSNAVSSISTYSFPLFVLLDFFTRLLISLEVLNKLLENYGVRNHLRWSRAIGFPDERSRDNIVLIDTM